MFDNNNAVNEVGELIEEFQSRLNKLKTKYKINETHPQPEFLPVHVPVFKPLKAFIFKFDPKAGMSDEEFKSAMKVFAIIREIMVNEQKATDNNS